jgi:hypothetical protein
LAEVDSAARRALAASIVAGSALAQLAMRVPPDVKVVVARLLEVGPGLSPLAKRRVLLAPRALRAMARRAVAPKVQVRVSTAGLAGLSGRASGLAPACARRSNNV